MDKIPTIYERDERFSVIAKYKPECDWVKNGEGIPTEKIDGTNIRVTIKDHKIIAVEKRRNPNRKEKEQGVQPRYVPASENDPSDKWIFACVKNFEPDKYKLKDGQYPCEAYGHKIQGDPLKIGTNKLYFFTVNPQKFINVPLDYNNLKDYIKTLYSAFNLKVLAEGIVFHHKDGRMAKIKRKDFK